MKMLDLEMLPAAEGDALLLTYGDTDDPHRILIDGGRRSTYRHLRERIEQIAVNDEGKRYFELLIVTHIDADHIEGIICLLQDEELNCDFGDIWFNDWNHLEPLVAGETPIHLGAAQGEFLGALLQARQLPWNVRFDEGAVVLPPDPEPLPVREFADELKLTIVSPTIESLIELREEWTKVIEAAGFVPGNRDEAMQQFENKAWSKMPRRLGDETVRRTLDHSEANGSSIAVLLDYEGVRLLLSGDAWPHVLRPSMGRWCAEQRDEPERVLLDAFKIPHHGSKKNVTPQLMESIECPTYLISTSGSRFHHPDVDAIRIIIDGHNGESKPEFLFNYRSDDNDFWDSQSGCDALYEDDAVLAYDVPD
ncbi:MAG: ComEC/Rec2 family competence protein [Woeseiaceae bacterium]